MQYENVQYVGVWYVNMPYVYVPYAEDFCFARAANLLRETDGRSIALLAGADDGYFRGQFAPVCPRPDHQHQIRQPGKNLPGSGLHAGRHVGPE